MSECIPSQNVPGSEGYAMRRVNGVRHYEHVIAWEEVNGPVPDGMVLDHLCHDPVTCHEGNRCPHRRCRNAEHLTPVTRGDNARRGRRVWSEVEECPDGHPYDATNTYTDPQGRRHCRACRPKHKAAHLARKRANA